MTSPARAPRPTPRRAAPAPAPRRPRLAVVPPPAPRRRHAAVLVAAGVLVFGSLLVAMVFYGLIAANQVHLDDIDHELDQERAALARERYQLANLQAPERIATEATRLGMVPASGQRWLSSTGSAPIVTDDSGPAAGPTTDERSAPDGATDDELAGGTGTEAGA